jgi:hypothetical protein
MEIKGIHAFTSKNDEFNSVEDWQETKGTHAFAPKNDKFNSVEDRPETKGTHASTPKNDEFNSVERREETKETHASTPKNDEFNSAEGRQETKGRVSIGMPRSRFHVPRKVQSSVGLTLSRICFKWFNLVWIRRITNKIHLSIQNSTKKVRKPKLSINNRYKLLTVLWQEMNLISWQIPRNFQDSIPQRINPLSTVAQLIDEITFRSYI